MGKVIEIDDYLEKELDIYARLTEAQLLNREDPSNALFIAESPKVIGRALDAGCQPVSIVTERKHIEGEGKDIISRCGDIPVYTAKLSVLEKITGYKLTRGMLCAMRRPALREPEEICKGARRIAVLENVVNPTNVGAIIRSAAALGIEAVLLTPGCSDPLYRRAVRVSMGTVFQVPWTYIGNRVSQWPEPGMQRLRNMGFRTAAMALSDDSVTIKDPALLRENKLAIILGTEGDGLSDKTVAGCDYTVKIPMSNGVDSLNVAAASAVAFWQMTQL